MKKILGLILLGLMACENNVPVETSSSVKATGAGDTLLPTRYLLGNHNLGAVLTLLSVNGLVIISDPLGESRIVALSLETGDEVFATGRSGDGPGEYQMPLLCGANTEGELCVFDARALKVDELELGDFGFSLVSSHRMVFTDGRIRRILRDSRGTLAVPGSGRPTLFTMDSDWNREATIQLPPIEGLDMSMLAAVPAAAFDASLLPGADWKAVVAYKYASRLDFVSVSTGEVETTHGPVSVEVEWDPRRGTTEASEVAYVDIDATPLYVFALFSGTSTGVASSIHVFDQTGAFIEAIPLGVPVSAIAVDITQKVILGAVSDPEPGVVVFDLPVRFR